MKYGEKGFTLLETVIAIALIAVAAGSASAATFQIFRNTERNNDYMTVVRQVNNAGYWISRDAQMAQSVATEPDFLTISWTEDVTGDPIYHSVTYSVEDLTDGIGKLKRHHVSSGGADEETMVAQYIYYDPNDVDDTSKASYEQPVLTVQLTSILEETRETREYRIAHRASLY